MKAPQTHYLSLIGSLLFAIATALLFTISFILGLSAIFAYLAEDITNVQSLIYATTIFFVGILLGVVSVVSFLRFLEKPAAFKPVSTSYEGWKITLGVIGAGLALFFGNLVQANSAINWLILPLLTIPAVMLPILTLLGLSTSNLPLGTRWRTWGTLGISLTATPFILFMLETVVIVVIILLVIIYAVANPDIAVEFEKLSAQLAYMDLQTEEALQLITPYILKPVVVIPAIIFIAVLVPLIEELIKPLAVWTLAAKLDSPAQGFAFGALSGAGFAIWETFNVSGRVTEWGVLLFTRIGTGLLHITTSAIMGGAIYLAIREKRYLRLLGTYLLAVLLHGLWNAAAITVSFSALADIYNQTDGYASLQWVSTAGLVILAIVMITFLIISNRRMQRTIPIAVYQEIQAQDGEADL